MYIDMYMSQCNIIVDSAKLTRCWSRWGENDVSNCDKIYFILDGEGTITIDGTEYHPHADQIVLIPKGSRVISSNNPDKPYYKYWCHFHSYLIDKSIFNIIKIAACFTVSNPNLMIKLFNTLVLNFESEKPYSKLVARAALMQIIAQVFKESGSDSAQLASEFPVDALERINTYVWENISRHITLDELADVLHFHPNYFIKFFNKYFGVSPLQYVSQVRIEEAKQMLRVSDLSIKEIAVRTGFYDLYHFSKRFKKMTGYSPTDYRRL
ncbi:MAG: helix-turn-helix domain-containing protein [Eubacteriales bacterium]|nr:helix-turn-helix domain-containing protein [Eubacteriales bacterium]